MFNEILHQNYNEYKYHVSNESLSYILNVMNSLYGGSDPYPSGDVDSIYYDTLGLALYHQCVDGNNTKSKFRIRGYGDGYFRQLHQKDKSLFTVIKKKQSIKPVSIADGIAPSWYSLSPQGDEQSQFLGIQSNAGLYGELNPVIRVKYKRYRFRIYDYRMTLDTNIEVSGFANSIFQQEIYGVLPNHVLEVKTTDPRPHLPLLGLMRLPQISFSKFLLGMNFILTGDSRNY